MVRDFDAAHAKVVDVARDVRSSPAFLERMEQTHTALAAALGAQVFSFMVLDPKDPSRLLASHGLMRGREPRLAEYLAHYRFHDPMAESFADFDKVFLLSDWAHLGVGKDCFTGEFLPQQDIRHIIATSKRMPGGLILGSAFHRGASAGGDFDESDRRLVASVSDHIARAAFGAMLREKVEALSSGATEIAPAGAGTLIFDALGDVVHADARALTVLRDLEALGALEALSDDAVALARGPSGGQLERRCALPFARLLHVRLAAFALSGRERGVLASLLEEELDPIEARLRRARLTPRERVIARLCAEGLSNDGIGFELGISPATVSVHLSRVFRKADVAGRVALTRWLHGG